MIKHIRNLKCPSTRTRKNPFPQPENTKVTRNSFPLEREASQYLCGFEDAGRSEAKWFLELDFPIMSVPKGSD